MTRRNDKKAIDDEIDSIRDELEQLRAARKREHVQHCLKMEEEEMRLSNAKRRFQLTKTVPLHQYVEASRKSHPEVISNYMLSMEARLCQSMHQMLLQESDLKRYHDTCSKLFEWMEQESHVLDETMGRTEVELLNKIFKEERAIASMNEEYKDVLESQREVMPPPGNVKKITSPLRTAKTMNSPRPKPRKLPLFQRFVSPVA